MLLAHDTLLLIRMNIVYELIEMVVENKLKKYNFSSDLKVDVNEREKSLQEIEIVKFSFHQKLTSFKSANFFLPQSCSTSSSLLIKRCRICGEKFLVKFSGAETEKKKIDRKSQ